ncbi:MAG: cell division protein FtsZ [Candidatus Paceibacterota bacterium]|jgi:cell division protein FtsZ
MKIILKKPAKKIESIKKGKASPKGSAGKVRIAAKTIVKEKKKEAKEKARIKKTVERKAPQPKVQPVRIAVKNAAVKIPTSQAVEGKEGDVDVKKVEVRVIGIGGGGGNIVSELSQRLDGFSLKKIDFIAANTDMQALEAINKRAETFAFGKEFTRGLGTGRNFSMGEAAARKEEERIKELFLEKKDMFILVSSLGGGTGTGATPVFAKIASDTSAKTLGIFTLPFAFEGKEKLKTAQEALEKIQASMNAVLVIPNDKIFKITKEDTPFHSALSLLNKHIASSLEGLLKIIYLPGLINIDWADVKATLEGKGKSAYLNVAQLSGKDNLDEFSKNLLADPILDYNFSQAESILFNIESSKNISLEQMMAVSERIHSAAPQAKIIFGLSQSPAMKGAIKATILATGNSSTRSQRAAPQRSPSRKKNRKIPADAFGPKQKIGQPGTEGTGQVQADAGPEIKAQLRRNAIEVKKAEKEQTEREEEKEKIFEIPAFLRRGPKSDDR